MSVLSPVARELIALIAARQVAAPELGPAPAPEDPPFALESEPATIYLTCRHCGLEWAGSRSRAGAAGWVNRQELGFAKDYCPTCVASIKALEDRRSMKPRRRGL